MIKTILTLFILCGYLNATETAYLTKKTLHPQNSFYYYIPKSLNQSNPHPILMALHGMSEYTKPTCHKWKKIAEEYNYILVCPVGNSFKEAYLRSPFDDRFGFTEILTYFDNNYSVNIDKSILVGFSRGGNIAIETGIMYPRKFKNIISIFGFYNAFNSRTLQKTAHNTPFKHSNFLLITGQKDATFQSISNGQKELDKYSIRSKTITYKNKLHSYPYPLIIFFRKAEKWLHRKDPS